MRTRLACAGIALAALALLTHYGLSWLAVTDLQERGSDFSTSYVAAGLIRSGHGAQLYDQQVEQAAHLALLPAGTRITLPFITPPTTALVALPLTFIDLAAASRVFSVAGLLLLALAVWIAVRAAPWPRPTRRTVLVVIGLAALAAPATLVLLLLGQMDSICALGLAGGYALFRRGRSGWAGLAIGLGFLAVKPHLALGLAVFLVARREWRALAGFLAAGGLVAAVSTVLAGPGEVAGFAAALGYSLGSTPESSTLGLPGLVSSWLGSGAVATSVDVVAMAAALAGCAALGAGSRRSAPGLEFGLLGATALSLALSPHLFAHDLVTLAPAFVWCMARAAAADSGSAWPGRASVLGLAAWAGGNLLVNADIGNAGPAPPGRLAPLALLLAAGIAAVAMRPGPRPSPGALRAHPGARRLQLGRGSGVGGSVE